MSLRSWAVSTADITAVARAWHLRHQVPVFEDPYARFLCGRFFGLALRFRPLERLVFGGVLKPHIPASMSILIRARYAEEALQDAVDRGIRQYVILGAGMDSFAFRRPDLLERIAAFEVDHPITQSRKLKRIARANLSVPPGHYFVEADLTEVSPVEALAQSPFDASKPAFVSLLGVSYYLTPETLSATARAMAGGLAPGSELVLDYLLDKRSSAKGHDALRNELLNFVRKRGEPMRSAYSLQDIDEVLGDAGFRVISNGRMVDLARRYRRRFGDLPTELPGIFAMGHFVVA